MEYQLNIRELFQSGKTIIERLDQTNDVASHENIVGSQEGKFADMAKRVLNVQKLFPKSNNNDPFLKKYSNQPGEEGVLRQDETVKTSSSIAEVNTKDTTNVQQKQSEFMNADPFGNLYLLWLFIISIGVGYNYWTLILRIAFVEGMSRHYWGFLVLDYIVDFVFVLDIYVQSRTGYMENGELVINALKTRYHYKKTAGFWLDCLTVLPLDLLYFVSGVNPVFRLPRLLKIHRFLMFYERIQVVTNRPNFFNLAMLLHHVFLIIHWVACAYFVVSKSMGYGSEPWVYPVLQGEWAEVRNFNCNIMCIYMKNVSL